MIPINVGLMHSKNSLEEEISRLSKEIIKLRKEIK